MSAGHGWAQVGWSDPAPGEPGAVRSLASRFQSKADDVRALTVELGQGIAGLEVWQGVAADGFRATHQRLRYGLDEFVVQYERCVKGLTSYVAKLDRLKHEADALLPRVVAAQRRANDPETPGLSPEAFSAFAAAQMKARGELLVLGARHDAIAEEHRRAVNACIDALESSDGSTALSRMFGQVRDVLGAAEHRISQIDDDVKQWVKDNANTIAALSDVVGDLANVVGVVAIAAPELAPLAVVLSAAAFGGHALAKSGGADVTGGALVFDALGVVAGGSALIVGKRADAALSVYRRTGASDGLFDALQAHNRADVVDAAMTGASTGKDGPSHFEKYWRPKDAGQWAKYGAAFFGPMAAGPALSVPFENAYEIGHQKDLDARAARAAGGSR